MPDVASGRRLHDVVTSPARRAAYESAGLWDRHTLVSRVAHWARSAPDRVAVVDDARAPGFTYARLHTDAQALASVLLDAGVRPGGVVSVQMPNWYETVVVDLAVLMTGAVLNPLLPIYRAREVRNALVAAGARHVVSPGHYRNTDYRALVREAAEGIDGVTHLVVDRHTRDLFVDSGSRPEGLPCASEVSELIFSSGTESAPKAIMHTEQTTNCGVRMAAQAIGLGEGDGVWMPSPIGHSTGLNYGVRMALYHGLTLTLQDKWDPEDALDLVARMRPAYTVAATTFLADLLDAAERRRADLSCLRLFSCGGAPVPRRLVEQAAHLQMTVLRLYGSTEVLIGSWNRPDSPWGKRIATEGAPFDHVELQVRDDSGKPVIGTPGELFVRSPSSSVGFFDDPERTAATFDASGWVRSGDLGVLDEDGYFTMVGRKKEILIRGGLNVAPREIEDLLVTMPAVKEAAVIGVPHDRLGEIGCAFIVVEGPAQPTLQEVVAYLRSRGLAPFKLPERLVIVDALPKTPTGKIQKFELVAVLAENESHDQEDVAHR